MILTTVIIQTRNESDSKTRPHIAFEAEFLNLETFPILIAG